MMKSFDSIATNLVIQVMPLLMREFQVRLDPHQLFSDPAYADHMLQLAGTARSERLKTCAALLQERLRVLGARVAPPSREAARLAEPALATAGTDAPPPPTRYVRSLR